MVHGDPGLLVYMGFDPRLGAVEPTQYKVVACKCRKHLRTPPHEFLEAWVSQNTMERLEIVLPVGHNGWENTSHK